MTLIRNGVPEKFGFFRYLSNIVINPFLAAIALWSVIYGFRIFGNTQSLIQTVSYLTPFIIYAWAALYVVSGSLMLWGSMLLRSKILSSGCALFAAAALMNALFVYSSGVEGYKWQAFNMVMFAAAALIRMNHLIRGELLVWVHEQEEK